MTPPALDIERLSVAYGGKLALNNINLKMAPGEILGVLGPNGAGKTTLVRSITGRIRPVAGMVRISGRPLNPGQPHRHSLALAPQALALYRHLTARENLQVFARLAGLKRTEAQQAVERALNEINLVEQGNRLVTRLSGGMQRRLHVAVALLNRPNLIILDEPTAGVDLDARRLIHQLARTRAAEGAAVVVVTHELTEAETLCDRIAVFDQGQLCALGVPSELINEHFGRAQSFSLRTSTDLVNEPLRHRLEALGLVRNDADTHWQAYKEDEPEAFLTQLHALMNQQQVSIAEFSVRRPDLCDLMRVLTQAKAA